MAGKTNKASAEQDPIAWAVEQGISPQSVNSPHFVLGFVRGCVRSALSAKDAAARQWNLEQAEELLAAHDAFLSGGAA